MSIDKLDFDEATSGSVRKSDPDDDDGESDDSDDSEDE